MILICKRGLAILLAGLISLPANAFDWNASRTRIPSPTGAPTNTTASPTSAPRMQPVGSSANASSGTNILTNPDVLCALESAASSESDVQTTPSDAGIQSNWRYDPQAWNREYQNRLNALAPNAKFYRGSPLSAAAAGTVTVQEMIGTPPPLDISVSRGGGTSQVSYAPALHNFENNSLGAYQAGGYSQLNPNLTGMGQCEGSHCVVLRMPGHSYADEHSSLQTSFRAVNDLKSVRFRYTTALSYDGACHAPYPLFTANILDGGAIVRSQVIWGDGRGTCHSQQEFLCQRSATNGCDPFSYEFNLESLPKEKNYTLRLDLGNNGADTNSEASIDNIQFLNTQNGEYGGVRNQSTTNTTVYQNVYTRFTKINGIARMQLPEVPILSGQSSPWAVLIPSANGAQLTTEYASSIPNDATNVHHLMSNGAASFGLSPTSRANGNKIDYTGNKILTVQNSNVLTMIAIKSDHKYFSQYPIYFSDAGLFAFDKQPPTITARWIGPNLITTETGAALSFSAADDIGLNSIGVVRQDKNGQRTTILENAFAITNRAGRNMRAIESLGKSYSNETVKIASDDLNSNTDKLQVFVRDFVPQGNGQYRTAYSALINLPVFNLADKNVTCDKYVVNVGETVQCRLPSAGIPRDSLIWVRDKGERGDFAWDSFPASTTCSGGNRSKQCYLDANKKFTAEQPGTYDLELLFYDANDNGHQLVRRSSKAARVVVQDNSVKPLSARLGEQVSIVFPPRSLMCGNPKPIRYKFFRRYPNGPTTPIGPPAGVAAAAVEQNGYTDSSVDANQTLASYAIKPVFDSGDGPQTGWDETHLKRQKPVATLDHFPLPDNPLNLHVTWENAGGSTPVQNPAGNIPLTPRTRIFSLSQSPNAQLAFQKLLPPLQPPPQNADLYKSILTFEGLAGSGIEAKANLVNKTLANANGEMPPLTEGNYDRLMVDDAGKSLVEQSLWVVGGDLAIKPFSQQRLEKAALLLRALQPSIDLTQCEFEGNQFVCKPQNNLAALKMVIPTLSLALNAALQNLYFDNANTQQPGGLLASPQWKLWADDNTTTIWPNASRDMTDLSTLSPDHPADLKQYTLGFATYDAGSLLKYDSQPGHNLFKTGSSLLTDWLPAMDTIFFERLIKPFAQRMQRSSTFIAAVQSYADLTQEIELDYYLYFFPSIAMTYPSIATFGDLLSVQLKEKIDWPDMSETSDDISPPKRTACPTLSPGSFEEWPSSVQTTAQKVAIYLTDIRTTITEMTRDGRIDDLLDDPHSVLNTLQQLNDTGRIICKSGAGAKQGGEANYSVTDDVIRIRGDHCENRTVDFDGVLFHEGVHAWLSHIYPASSAPETSTLNSAEAKKNLLEILLNKKGRENVFSEFRAHWDARIYANMICAGDTRRNRQVATLEEDLLQNYYYSLVFSMLGTCTISACREEGDLHELVPNGPGYDTVPWSPIGRNVP